MIVIVKNSLIVGVELKYTVKQKLDSLDNFFKLIKILNEKINNNNNNLDYTRIDTNKSNIYLLNIDDKDVLKIIQNELKQDGTEKIENNMNNENDDNKINFNETDFNLEENDNKNKKEKIKVGIEKSFEDFSSFFWNN